MRAAVVRSFGGPEAVEVVPVDVPEPDARQVRIKVAAATLNPVDAITREGVFGGEGGQTGLGWDVAGTVEAVGADAAWSVGDEVVALQPGMAKPVGTHAEYVVVDTDAVAAAPATADAVAASTLPLNALTAAQALDLLELTPGRSLLVTGAAGAVGGFAVQLAAHRGIEVTALARQDDEELVRSLGAAGFVAADSEPAADGSYDAVLDAAVLGEAALARVRDGGAYAGVIPPARPASVRGVRTTAVQVGADGARLAELVRLVDEGVLTLRVAETFALDDAAKAHARLAEGGVRGRLVLVP
ncbi:MULTISPECIES: NADP-dependent oxidoreductase [unclassified Streptomyces]|uniref:NADP-dependent oxidoreductase n=1 Tax=unclassified Streptomyces TaxID=2593676 RepID=UPI001F04E002|nr:MULTISPECIES: NADP-dependent oxidoreductase [unclassified Streptomyces]MCH0563145.1 NADP-dependent oxidoreductase [Streptomyces sp. MUM 2J]MCH0568574.1 NADP-dependent oxidoreductase [Streptomyces sp. MUM 136J]